MAFLADLGVTPVFASVTFADRAEALASPAAPMRLAYCGTCGFVRNVAFDPTLLGYDVDYDNSLHFSGAFSTYAGELARELARRYDLEGKEIVELGCGKGQFLIDLCRAARARGTGFDRSYDGSLTDADVSFVQEYMSWDHPVEFDFFVSRHVIEHLVDPVAFLSGLRTACGERPVQGYVEVPDAIYDFERSPWNCPYTHVSYFSANSIGRLLSRTGFGERRLQRKFEGQFLGVELGVNVTVPAELLEGGTDSRHEQEVLSAFRRDHHRIVQDWRDRLEDVGFERCVLWGAGTKGVGFLNLVDPDGRMAGVVDLNPAKWGQFLPVTGHRIGGPGELPALEIDTVIITNPVYEAEIRRTLADLGAEVSVLLAH